jgi:hypothetical protein
MSSGGINCFRPRDLLLRDDPLEGFDLGLHSGGALEIEAFGSAVAAADEVLTNRGHYDGVPLQYGRNRFDKLQALPGRARPLCGTCR